jgi:hypothetical protein
MLSGDLLHGIKKFGSGNIGHALKDLGSINLSKLIDLDFDLPNKFSFSAPEVKALKDVIDAAGFPALEKALRGLDDFDLDIDLGDLLNGLLEACKKGDSFTPDTRVLLADGRTKRIAAVRVGDEVLATDPRTGRTGPEKVTDLHRNLDREFADVTVTEADGSRARIRTTADHPIWNATDRRWNDAADLDSGDALLARRGSATVAGVREYRGARYMHNLTVANVHTYYVLADRTPVLVHNCEIEKPRYGDSDLLGTGKLDTTYQHELKLGPDGNMHFPNDPVGTWRDVNGGLHDITTGRRVTDDNKPNLTTIDIGAGNPRSTSSNVPNDTGAGSVSAAKAVRNGVDQQRKDLWNTVLGPIAIKLRQHGIEVNEATLSPKKIDKLLTDSTNLLTLKELKDLGDVGRQYNKLAVQLRDASEQLGTAGGAYVARTQYSTAKTITNGEGLKGSANNLDRILFDESGGGRIIAIEEKGVGSKLGSRLVEDVGNPTGPKIRVEQMSTEYLRHMLQNDNKLGPLLSKDPVLRAKFQRVLDGTGPDQIEYLRVTTSADGVVTVDKYLVDGVRLGRGVISIAGTP